MQTQMPINSQKRPLRRTAALLCAVLAGLGLAAGRAAAQTGPLTTSPPFPVPYQWQNYHSGGADTPYPSTATEAPFLTPNINPIQGELEGTPTEFYLTNLTQIPSYLLGNYDPTRPPAGLQGGAGSTNTYYPNHFADGDIFSWAAPFSYLPQTGGTVTADDSSAAPTGGAIPTSSGFTASPTFTTVTLPGAGGADTSPAAGTATNSEYLRLASGTNGSAIWTLFEPTAGNYSLYFHIPNDLPDTAGTIEPRDTEVIFAISVRDAAGNVTSNSTAVASQTEANDSQFLAGPLQVASGGSVVVTLTRSTTVPKINNNADYLVADSMTLQQTTGDVESAPTVINTSLYPADFASTTHPLQYWGIYVPPGLPAGATEQAVGTTAVSNANPDTTGAASPPTAASLNAGNVVLKTGTSTDNTRRIRQLVYFGRSDPSATITTSSVDDSQPTQFTNTGTSTLVTNATATNGKYLSYPATAGAAPTTLVATWTIPSPASSGGNNSFVYAHIPATPGGEIRNSTVFYTVQVNGGTPIAVQISQVTAGAAAQVLLPTGPLAPAAGSNIVVKLYSENGIPPPTPPVGVVVADSITVSTPTGQGAVYCVDGFTGGVVWRFETPGSANGPSAPVFGSPTVTKINVLVTPAVGASPAVYANRLVVIVADNNGLVYCLDAIGNGDGTSNSDALAKDANGNPIAGQPVTIPQPAYAPGLYGDVPPPAPTGTAAQAALTAHVGTTGVYWIYRPDASRPKFLTGTQKGFVKPIDPTADLPVPAAFNTASPAVFVDPTINATAPTASNSKVYIGNSNGVLYALDGAGAGIDTTSAATLAASGDTFNYSQNLQGASALQIPSAQPLWWFNLRGPDPNSGNTASNADFESAPAIYVATTMPPAAPKYTPIVFVGSAHEQESTSNVGRLYALDGTYGPSGDNGRTSPLTQPNPALPNYTGPGSFNYNVGQRPQTSKTDTVHWSFPDAVGNDTYTVSQSYNSTTGKPAGPRPALGNITGSPVVFTNIHETTVAHQTRLYFAADSGFESTTATPIPAVRPDQTLTGRLWAVNLDGSVGTTTNTSAAEPAKNNVVWSYPLANDPNDAALDATPEPYAPIGSFLRATPAIGFVQFPTTIVNGDAGATSYNPVDAVATTGIDGLSVPMLYVGTQGVNDTALYAVDIDGGMTLPNTTPTNDQRTIYRVVSPDGSIFQSSPALVANATKAGGNGGSVYAVAGNTLYDYSATPISNPLYTSAQPEPYPLIRENRAFTGFGPISSPAVAGADVSDITSAAFTTYTVGAVTHNTTDWVYVGDSTSGFCRGITPNDPSYGGIPLDLGTILPPTPTPPTPILLNALIQTYLVSKTAPAPQQASKSSADAAPFGVTAPLPTYEWGESAYARFTNVAPPNPVNAATGYPDPNLFVHDSITYTAADISAASATNPVPFYSSDGSQAQTVTFNLADTETGVKFVDSGSVQARVVGTPPDGFVADAAPATGTPSSAVTTNLVANNGNHYLGTYTYTIADGSARNNTPGARRHFQNVRQTVTEWDFENLTGDGLLTTAANYVQKGTAVIGGDAATGNIVSTYDKATNSYSFSKVAAVDQPTFGVLNPLAVRGGGVSQVPAPTPTSSAVQIGDEEGPFRGVKDPLPINTTAAGAANIDFLALQALTNGNVMLTYAPPSSSGVTGNPTQLATGTNDVTGVNTPTATAVVVTSTGLIAHNTTGSNGEPTASPAAQGAFSTDSTDGLLAGANGFGGYGLNVFDRGALYQLGQILRLKMTVPTSTLFAPPSGRDGLYWNSNSANDLGSLVPPTHDAVVNFLPWETLPTPYSIGGNSSLDYPDIAPGSFQQSLQSETNGGGATNTSGDLTSNYVTLTPGFNPSNNPLPSRTVYGDPVNIQISVPHYQPANQQLYQQNKLASGQTYSVGGQIAPVTTDPMTGAITSTNNIATTNVFPMGYVTSKRLFVPNASGFYSYQRPYWDVRVYTGVPIDMRTSIVNPTTDIGKVPAAFGVQTESYPGLNPVAATSFFTPYNPAFQNYFKPLEIHNDGNVNLLNVHLDQKISSNAPLTLQLNSDVEDPLSNILGYDLPGITGPRSGAFGTAGSPVPEQPYLIRTSLDSDLISTYDRNPALPAASYPGVTFHKPTAGGNQPSTLSIPDSPETFDPNFTVAPSPTGLPVAGASAPPFVSIAMPFGTPVGTYRTSEPQLNTSLRLFEGIDTKAADAYIFIPNGNSLYPPQYGKAVGGIGTPVVDTGTSNTGQPLDSSATPQPEDIYNGLQPLSTTGTQLTGTVVEQRLTDGATYGATPMVDVTPQGTTNTGSPDFAPAAFRDPATGNLSVYWTSGRGLNYGIYGAAVPFTLNPAGNTIGQGYFLPADKTQYWWSSIGGYSATAPNPLLPVNGLVAGTNSGLSVVPAGANLYAFVVNVASTTPYSNSLYSYQVTPGTGILVSPQTPGPISPSSDNSQVKYGVKGLYTPGSSNFANPLWAFWTATTRGRTALYYNSLRPTGGWNESVNVLPVPAGLTSVADASPLLMPITVGPASSNQIEVTYSGTSPDGKTDLYVSRYQPDGTTAPASSKLDLVAFPATTENLTAANGWYQARDVAWSRTGALNLFVNYAGGAQTSLLYNGNTPLFTKAIFDKASGLLVLTGVKVPNRNAAGALPPTTNTVYVDAATGRIRFSPALLLQGTTLNSPTQNFAQIRATFSPTAHRLTTGTDSRANTGPVTFLDAANKANDAPGAAIVEADRRWTIWRKASAANDTASSTLYYKTQRLTFFVPTAIDPTKSVTVTLGGTATTNYDLDYERGRLYFPIKTGAEGETVAVNYTDLTGGTHSIAADPTLQNTVQWQDEVIANNNDVIILDSAAGLDNVTHYAVPIDTAINENNVAAFLDPFAGPASSHKIWLFWNSTRNGTADIYSETIDPRFAPGP